MVMWLLLACTEDAPPQLAPDTHGWKEEGDLVVAGLTEVRHLWREGHKDAARVYAERVYTERWEPRLEPALQQMEGPLRTLEIEYRFGQLIWSLERTTPLKQIEADVQKLEQDVRTVADAAGRAFPPPGTAPQPPASTNTTRPIVPDVPPAWEREE